ncbi:MAG: hypothetical protein R3C61_09940 [Bacteroidia bacterium]
MKFLTYVLLCLLTFSFSAALHAQTTHRPISSNERAASAPVAYDMKSDIDIQKQNKQEVLSRLVSDYKQAPESQQKFIANQIHQTLFDLFDLSLIDLEAQAESLSGQLQKMENTPQFRTRSQDIQALQDALEKVNSSIEWRRANREKIVAKRLSEILASEEN